VTPSLTAGDPSVYAHSEDVAVVGDGDRIIVLDLNRLDRSPEALVGTAARIWQTIDGEQDEEKLVAHLADQFDTTPEQIADDVRGFLTRLLTLGLVVRTADPQPVSAHLR
jgi:Coenzyme PQQ synthesis protein D (PqqD)